jgi:uncharacterized protein YfdQ (DUF2303 family)
MDSTAINSIGQLAIEGAKANRLDTSTPAIILTQQNGTQCIESLERLQTGRSRFRGSFASNNLQDFAEYIKGRFENEAMEYQAQGFINTDKMQAQVYFNLGDIEHPGHGDHIALLSLKPTAAYAALSKHCGLSIDQRCLHDFIEDWRDNIMPIYDGKASDKPLTSTLAAIRDITVETARSITHVDRDMGASRSAMESVDAKSKLTLPTGFTFQCVPYEGLQERTFNLRLGVNTGSDKISLLLRIQQAESTTEVIAKDFRDRLAAKLGVASTLTLGTFTP